MTVALSRARLGLYILGRRDVFESCYELRPAFELLFKRPDSLRLVTGEMWPSERILADEGDEVEGEAIMESVEHLGNYVFEMTKSKLQLLQSKKGASGKVPVQVGAQLGDAPVEDEHEEEVVDDDQEAEEVEPEAE